MIEKTNAYMTYINLFNIYHTNFESNKLYKMEGENLCVLKKQQHKSLRV